MAECARSSLSHLYTLYNRSGVADDTGLELSLPCLTCVENALCSSVRVNLCFTFCTSVCLFFFLFFFFQFLSVAATDALGR